MFGSDAFGRKLWSAALPIIPQLSFVESELYTQYWLLLIPSWKCGWSLWYVSFKIVWLHCDNGIVSTFDLSNSSDEFRTFPSGIYEKIESSNE